MEYASNAPEVSQIASVLRFDGTVTDKIPLNRSLVASFDAPETRNICLVT